MLVLSFFVFYDARFEPFNEYNVSQLINHPQNTINHNFQAYIWTKIIVNTYHVYLKTSKSCIIYEARTRQKWPWHWHGDTDNNLKKLIN